MASDKLEKAYREDLVADVKKGIGITEVPDKVVRLDSIPFTELSEAYPTGFKQLDDKFLGGFRGGNLVLISGYSGNGKTTLSLQITQNYSKLVIPVMWFTYEMPINELQWKLDQMGGYKGLNLFVPKIHTTGDINWLKKKVLEGIVLHNSKVIVIDNLDFLTINSGEDKLTMQKKIVGMLKGIAIEYDVIVFLNVHITKIEEGKEPRMQNIYGASETYKLADAVIFIHRIKEEVGRGEQSLNYTKISKIIVDKNRLKGILGTFELEFKNNRFEELTPEVNYVNKALNKANVGGDRNRRISC